MHTKIVSLAILLFACTHAHGQGTNVFVPEGSDIDVTVDTPANNDIGVRSLGGSPPTGLVRVNGAGTAFFGFGMTDFTNADCADATAATYNTSPPPAAFLPSDGDVYLVNDGSRYGKLLFVSVTENSGATLTWDTLGTCAVDPAPVSSFTFTTYDQIGFFTDTSTNSPNAWSWDFNGEGNSSQQDPSFFFSTDGMVTVSLTASNAGGTGNTAMQNVNLTQQPSQTRSIGGGFDLDSDGMNDLNVIAPDGCSGNITLSLVNGSTRSGFSQDYRTVGAGNVPAMITGTGNFCGIEGVPGLFDGFFIQSSLQGVYKIWAPEISNTSIRIEFAELVAPVPVELMEFNID